MVRELEFMVEFYYILGVIVLNNYIVLRCFLINKGGGSL